MPLQRSDSCVDIDFTLRRKFGKTTFRYSSFYHIWMLGPLIHNRPLQRDVITAALDGQDVFVQAATSFGKSLCFQLPAVIDHGSEYDPTTFYNKKRTNVPQSQLSSRHCYH